MQGRRPDDLRATGRPAGVTPIGALTAGRPASDAGAIQKGQREVHVGLPNDDCAGIPQALHDGGVPVGHVVLEGGLPHVVCMPST